MQADNLRRLEAVFTEALALPAGADLSRLRQLGQPSWDSLGHVTLMAAIEGEFGIQLDIDDMIVLTSFDAARLYLEDKGL